jgi:DNA-binding MarR family transcriptional regulator
MEREYHRDIHRINYIHSEMNALYHQASLKLNISDNTAIVLYTIYDLGDGCLLSDIYKTGDLSRQTVNSIIRKLEAEDILHLVPYNGKSKKILLTTHGQTYMQETVAQLYQSEMDAFKSWTDEELNTYLQLMEKHLSSLRQQMKEF